MQSYEWVQSNLKQKKNKSGRVAIPNLQVYWDVPMREQEKET